MNLQVYCDLDKSFRIVDEPVSADIRLRERTAITVATVRCNRADPADNARGLELACTMAASPALKAALNALLAAVLADGGEVRYGTAIAKARQALAKAQVQV